jgi:hypothetical protein
MERAAPVVWRGSAECPLGDEAAAVVRGLLLHVARRPVKSGRTGAGETTRELGREVRA